MTEATAAEAASLETPADAGEGARGVVTRWLKELELAAKHEEHWRDAALDACRRYRDEDSEGQVGYASTAKLGSRVVSNRFNILYSNVQTICPAIYAAMPRPDVRRRHKDRDKLAKEAATILERALSYSMDVYDFDLRMKQAVKDMQITGRGVTRVRYKPYFSEDMDKAPDGKPERRLAYEAVCCEHVPWQAFRVGPGRTWDEVPWIAFGPHLLRKEQIADAFGKAAAEDIELDYSPANIEGDGEKPLGDILDTFKRAKVWEIWDRDKREVLWVAESFTERPLRVDDDPYGLESFFPIPRPLYAVETTDTLVPVEPFRFYSELARELSRLTMRIEGIIDACQAKGIYDATITEMERLTEEGDNILIPSDTAAHLMAKGGIEGGIWMWPVDKIAAALKYLYEQRDAVKQTIYEVTGIADIMRGATDARETLGSQRLKAQFGTMRIDDQRRDVQRYARDLVRIKSELIAEKFSVQTLQQMTGVQLPDAQQKAMAQQQVKRAQMAQQPVPPQLSEMLEKPLWDEVQAIIRSDGPRGFRVDVETDQTVASDDIEEKKAVTEFMTALAGFVQGIGPAVQSGQIPKDAAVKLLLAGVRRFKFGREVEDAFDEIAGDGQPQQQQQGPNPEEIAAQAEQQRAAAEIQLKQQEAQARMQVEQQKLALEQQKAQAQIALEREKAASEAEAARERMQAELQLAREKQAGEMQLARFKASQDADIKRTAAAQKAQQTEGKAA